MIIIWGFRAMAKKLAKGVFFCPSCGGDREYTHQQVRRWFTFFWIPIFPTKTLGEQIECGTCNGKFVTAVLTTPTSGQLTDWVRNASRAAAASLLVTGDPTDAGTRRRAVQAMHSIGIDDYTDDVLAADLVHVDPAGLAAFVEPLAEGLTDQGREMFVARLVAVAGEGPLTPGQQQVLATVGASLGMSRAHVAGVLGSGAPVMPELPAFAPTAQGTPATPAPAAPVPTDPPAGWYPDPQGGAARRWWDGQTWTDHLQP